jgi:hypothetical protein
MTVTTVGVYIPEIYSFMDEIQVKELPEPDVSFENQPLRRRSSDSFTGPNHMF